MLESRNNPQADLQQLHRSQQQLERISIRSTSKQEKPTDNQIRIEIIRNWHDDLLKSIEVVGITHSPGRPWDVYVPRPISAEDKKDSFGFLTFPIQVLHHNDSDHRMVLKDRNHHFHVRESKCTRR